MRFLASHCSAAERRLSYDRKGEKKIRLKFSWLEPFCSLWMFDRDSYGDAEGNFCMSPSGYFSYPQIAQ